LALRGLHPEPGAARVENQLVWLLVAPEKHRREDLDVEEVLQVLLVDAFLGKWLTIELVAV
jgi:hypothetical protein